MPKVSVCIPSYNHARYIGSSIESVLSQTFSDFELVIVDNCSEDDTEEVIRGHRDPRIRFSKNERNLGLVRNWNRCLALARGDYVVILPADDLLLPRMLERAVPLLDAHPTVAFTYGSYHLIDENGQIIKTNMQWKEDRIMTGLDMIRNTLFEVGFARGPSVVMRRECYTKLGGFDEKYEFVIDWDLYARLARLYDVGYIAEPVACFRYEHPGGVTARKYLRNPRLATSEEFRLLEEILRQAPATAEWRQAGRLAYRKSIDRHVAMTYRLLRNGEPTRFRSELIYAMTKERSLPLRHRKMTVLWFASLFGLRFALFLDAIERTFWQRLQA